jgi:hypothetical protein
VSQEQQKSEIRSKINLYTTSTILALSVIVFLTVIPFLPGVPIVPLLIGLGLGIASLRRAAWAAGVFALLAILSIVNQLVHFGLANFVFTALSKGDYVGVGISVLLLLFSIVNLAGARSQPTSFALAMLSVALTMTGYFWLSIATLVIAAAMGGIRSIGTVSSTFTSTMIPLLLMANALDYKINPLNWATTPPFHPTPIIFSQLGTLASNFAPPLACFNVAAGCVGGPGGQNYSNVLTNFLSNGAASAVLIIPLIMLGIIFSSSASIAGIAHALLLKFSWHEKAGPIIRISAPLVAAIVTPIAFVTLISVLAPIGPFRTDLVLNNSLNLSLATNIVAGALLVGAVFTAREFGIQRLERLEFARNELTLLIKELQTHIDRTGIIVQGIISKAPTISVAGEEKQLEEYGTYIKDILAGLENASFPSLEHWIKDIQDRVEPSLTGMPERLRMKVIDELNRMIALANAYNNQLEETGVQLRFPDVAILGDMTYEEALAKYGEVTSGIGKTTTDLFDEYSLTTTAFNKLMNKELIVPPIDPVHLLEVHDYPASMKLVVEDYWVSFNFTYAAELSKKAGALLRQLQSASGLVDESTKARMGRALELLPKAKPTISRQVLEVTEGLLRALSDSLNRVRMEFEQMEKLVKSLTPGTRGIVRFAILDLFGAQERLAQRMTKLKPAFDELIDFTEDFAAFMAVVAEGRKEDTRNIVILSQYHLAKRYIEGLAEGKKAIPIGTLPFQRDAALIYVKLMAEETRLVRYDDANEEIVIDHAKM